MGRRLAIALLGLALGACALGDGRRDDAGPGGGFDAGRPLLGRDAGFDAGAPTGTDAGPPTGTDAGPPTGTDAGPPTGTDAGPPTGTDAGGGGALDPRLALPDSSGTPCSAPGSMSACPGIEVCRFYSASEGRCESCGACGNLNAFCSTSADCDILFMCFSGRCTNFCTLGTFECGPIEDCIDIGHPTRGVCRPF